MAGKTPGGKKVDWSLPDFSKSTSWPNTGKGAKRRGADSKAEYGGKAKGGALGSSAAAAPAKKAAKPAKSGAFGGWTTTYEKAAEKKPKSDYSSNRAELGDFYLNATSGMFSDKAGGKKKK